MSNFSLACRHAVSDRIPLRSLYAAIVVGTILNLINQGDALFGGNSCQLDETFANVFCALRRKHLRGGFVSVGSTDARVCRSSNAGAAIGMPVIEAC